VRVTWDAGEVMVNAAFLGEDDSDMIGEWLRGQA
jgi:hypothetical protein